MFGKSIVVNNYGTNKLLLLDTGYDGIERPKNTQYQTDAANQRPSSLSIYQGDT